MNKKKILIIIISIILFASITPFFFRKKSTLNTFKKVEEKTKEYNSLQKIKYNDQVSGYYGKRNNKIDFYNKKLDFKFTLEDKGFYYLAVGDNFLIYEDNKKQYAYIVDKKKTIKLDYFYGSGDNYFIEYDYQKINMSLDILII